MIPYSVFPAALTHFRSDFISFVDLTKKRILDSNPSLTYYQKIFFKKIKKWDRLETGFNVLLWWAIKISLFINWEQGWLVPTMESNNLFEGGIKNENPFLQFSHSSLKHFILLFHHMGGGGEQQF